MLGPLERFPSTGNIFGYQAQLVLHVIKLCLDGYLSQSGVKTFKTSDISEALAKHLAEYPSVVLVIK